MAGKLYKYNDSWVSYGYLHDTFGYTDAPSFDISYKSTNPWGEMDTTGYMSSTDFYDIRTYELWKQGLVGWYSMNEMAVQGSYPDTAIETMMRNGNVTSNAAYITAPNGVDYYIVQAAISDGWLTLDEWALLGWEPYTVTQIPLGGSMGADYSESMMGYPAERMERGGIGFTGSLRENFIPESGVVEADSDGSIEVLLGSQWNGSTWAGGEVQYQNSSIARLGVMSQIDADLITDYGLTLTGEILAYHSGPFGFINYNSNYEFEVTGVYTDVSGETPVSTDISWFAMNYNNNWVNLGGAGWGPPYLVSGIKTARVKIKAVST